MSGTESIYAVIGDPINHSLSPTIHNAAFALLGEDCAYFARRVEKGGLRPWIEEALRAGVRGFNATMPHKVDIIPLLDEMDGAAAFYHSVNTVRIENGNLKGFNTDAEGFTLSLEEAGAAFEGRRVLIAGAGGVTNTLAAVALSKGARGVTVLNRTPERLRALCAELKLKYGFSPEAGDLRDISAHAARADIFINATPLGMHGAEGDWDDLGFVGLFGRECVIYDLIYNPARTTLLERAEDCGLVAINGLGMLVYQAVLADEIFLGRSLNRTELKNKIISGLSDAP